MKPILSILKGMIPSRLKEMIPVRPMDKYVNECYAQEGEDIVLSRLLYGRASGFYVDIGAYKPKLYSNTYLFYKRGWSGLNIDALPGSMDAFHSLRPRDINLEMGIGPNPGILPFYVFTEPGLNTFDSDLAKSRELDGFPIIRTLNVPVKTLSSILDQYARGKQIDILSIDAEGLDEAVLFSNDFDRYRPKTIAIEYLRMDLRAILESPSCKFLEGLEYSLHSRLYNSAIFADRRAGLYLL